ncbi:hypothetical protein B0I72DRAFT_29232 [Yarrowia lipolytica]|uniref:YALI0D11286p n=2 Tax=Yarrowia lipolytica TaxID=4952 RepID=Q6C9H0_YARLI|nr:YALI0D11286p [Yarrowia lipolytica CLIB122]AOW03917.1 hypothetical protein YALI1_D14180g [Yarrowia lipolytica]KAB8283027.1 hypothetical protein BKA91DRAFT_17248 [Yarrowia lipolytica]KAE8172411.1 hypothetical protein BKA90DRAFT_18752 [Yarrowia lipolytica]KAJ8054515.1 hypothetical protein LXG23DRAFT_48795 [Yarrowia lipolytica]QNP98448.1 Hypothetical protein YALI2_D00889g [Yarrowia lipolytica]|eukprot:XP_502692.1 YALI0D11286p [Yarrowia lipolytica CLIB122]
MSQHTTQVHKHNTTPFTPKFSASLVARFPALEQPKTSLPKQAESRHRLLKRVAKPLDPQSKRPKQRVQVPYANKHLRRPVKHTFSGRVHDLNVAKIIKTSSLRNGHMMQSVSSSVDSGRSKSLEAQHEDRLQDFASKQLEFREYMKQVNSGHVPDASDHSRSVSPASVADSLSSESSKESSPGVETKQPDFCLATSTSTERAPSYPSSRELEES